METGDRKKIRWAAGSVVILSILFGCLAHWGVLEPAELKSVDFRMKWSRQQKPLTREVALVLVDEASLSSLNGMAGRWPWPRHIHAELIDFFFMCGARAVLFDVLFSENENSVAGGLSEGDAVLAAATQSAGNVYHAMQLVADQADEFNSNIFHRSLPEAFRTKLGLPVPVETVSHPSVSYPPLPALWEAARGVGVVSFKPDPDGIFRRERLVFAYDGAGYPALALAPFVDAGDSQPPEFHDGYLRLFHQGRYRTIPLDENRRYFVNMYGRYNVYSYSGVYLTWLKIQNGEMQNLPVDPTEFRDKVVFIGASAAGVEDLKHTAMGPRTPGVYLHASIYGNIIEGDFLTFAPAWLENVLGVIAVGLAVAGALFLREIKFKILFSLLLMFGYASAAVLLFAHNYVIAMVHPLGAAAAAYIVSFTFIGFTEGRERRKIKTILGQYVSPAVLTTILSNCQQEYLCAEVGTREELTIFFSDIRGFTAISESYPVEQVVEVLNGYLSKMVDIIFENSGTLDKFIGDAIVAFWGAPLRTPRHHYHAVHSALCMRRALVELNRENQARALPMLEMGIGIHTGEVILGNIGSNKKLDYTIIGDGVNLTSRLEGLTKTYQTPVLISKATHDHLGDQFCCRIVDYVKVKGKQRPILIYEALGAAKDLDPDLKEVIRLCNDGFQRYRQRDFEGAKKAYAAVQQWRQEDFLSRLYIQRCDQFLRHPPPELWDGCHVHLSK
jgi:adenylate cyclase